MGIFEGKKGPCGSAKDENRSFLLFLRENRAPAGALKTRIGRLGIFEGKKIPCRSAKDENRSFLKKILKKVDFWKLLGMGWPGVGNVPRPCGSIYCLSRGSQEPYRKKSKF